MPLRPILLLSVPFSLIAVGALTGIFIGDGRRGSDELPLAGVPNARLVEAGVVLERFETDSVPIDRAVAESLSHQIACCGAVKQTVLVRLTRPASGQEFVSWAVSFDTSTGLRPISFPVGGPRIHVLKSEPFLVLFLDARSGKLLCNLGPGNECIWPEDAVVIDGMQRERLAEAGIQLELPALDDRAEFVPNRERVAADAPFYAPISEIILVRAGIGGEPILAWAVTYGSIAPPISDTLRNYLHLYDATTGGNFYRIEVPIDN